jgi:predicted MFS family arabinose efflux permease
VTSRGGARPLLSARVATFLVFVVNGAAFGTWVASIPGVQSSLGASATEMGLVLLSAALGAITAQQVVGQLLVRISTRHMLMATSLVFPLLVPLPLLAPNPLALALVMFVFGAANTSMDVSMNAHGVALETAGGRSLFSGLHAGWAIGGAIGAAGVALAVGIGMAPLAEAVLAGIGLWLVALLVGRYVGVGTARTEGANGIHLPSRTVLPIALLVVLVAYVEGGLADWGGVYLRSGVGANAEVAALAYAAFSVGMTISRLGGDAVKDRVGSIRLIQLGMLLVAVALAATLVIGNAAAALIGLVVAGVGVGNAIPQLFGAAGRIPPHGPSLSAAFTFLTLAFVTGPPIIGTVSDAVGIAAALGLLVLASFVVAVAILRVPGAETNPRFSEPALPEPLPETAR